MRDINVLTNIDIIKSQLEATKRAHEIINRAMDYYRDLLAVSNIEYDQCVKKFAMQKMSWWLGKRRHVRVVERNLREALVANSNSTFYENE